MEYPLSKPNIDLDNGRFSDGVPGVKPASAVPADTLNMIVDELRAVVVAGGLVPDEHVNTQVRDSLQKLIATPTARRYFFGQI